MFLQFSMTDCKENGQKIIEAISQFRTTLSSKYPDIDRQNLNCALDLAQLILNTFTADSKRRIWEIEKQQKQFIKIIQVITGGFFSVIAAIIAVLAQKFL